MFERLFQIFCRYKVETCARIAEDLRVTWTPSPCLSLHWDGKLMSTLSNSDDKVEERLPILVTGTTGTKLLGVPALPHKSGEKVGPQIAQQSKKLLQEWECEECVVSMVFDTTASNTGAITAACVSIQGELGRPLLWTPCRKHVGEVVVHHLWDALLIEASKSPNVSLFKRFRDVFPQLSYSRESLNIPETPPELLSKKEEVITVCKNFLEKQDSYRGDYKELATLSLLYLDDSKTKASFEKFLQPGATHSARWMAKLIYSLKAVLLGRI